MTARTCLRRLASALLLASCLVSPLWADDQSTDADTDELRQQIELMQRELMRLQQRLGELEAERAESRERVNELEAIEQRVAEVEQVAEAEQDGIDFGGAVRLNYAWRDYDDQNKDRFGDFELELFRINVAGSVGDVLLDAEWRRYNDFHAIHHAWVGYDYSDELQMQLGITQVPFGIGPYMSRSFWFTGNYYVGLEDDYDTGIKFVHRPNDRWSFDYAFFKNPEYASDGRADRYSFDLVTAGEQQNTETNQLNFRAVRHLNLSDESSMDLGLSLEAGQIYNRTTEDNGERWAIGAHMDYDRGPWNLRLQALRYEYDPENPDGVSDDFVQMGAFAFPFLIASKSDIYTYSVSRAFDVEWGPITGLRCYNEGTFFNPDVAQSDESIQSVTGCSVSAGGVFAYVDWIAGKNMWFAGGDGIGRGAGTAGDWKSRLNINLGYYF
ncbi:hypothetical protein [Wenzhouxiangella marina]|nr:hypothetical protein [Wenzhouxiangella marina]MBB6088107.1 hypothetical protein [Wenzhouxiangella marina]